MKLNPDCIRDILLVVEEKTSPSSQFVYKPSEEYINKFHLDDESEEEPQVIHERLKSYTDEDILYHINQCELSGFFTEVNQCTGYLYFIQDLSPLGHQFLADIRSDTNWNKTKDIAKKVGSFSLNTLKDISVKVVSDVISKSF